MNCKRQKIVHVFEEKLCRFCAKSCGSKCYNIFENLLLYKQKQISFENLINIVLGLTVESEDGKSPYICDFCKIKLIDFYDFKSQCREEAIEVPANLEVTVIKTSLSPRPLQPQADNFEVAVIKTSHTPQPANLDVILPLQPQPKPMQPQLQQTLKRPLVGQRRTNIQTRHGMNHLDESVNVPIVDTEVKAVLVLFISILTKENLWTEHDRKFNKWNGELFSKTSQKCTIPRKYGDKCGVELNSFYKYLAHVIIYHLLESFCPKCKIPFVGANSLAEHFISKCLSISKALKHEKYRHNLFNRHDMIDDIKTQQGFIEKYNSFNSMLYSEDGLI